LDADENKGHGRPEPQEDPMPSTRALWLSVLCLAVGIAEGEAQTWPSKPVKAIVPFAAGSVTDIVPRVVFAQLAERLGQPIVVENRPGAGGTTAATMVAKADPDGETVLVNSSAHTIAPALYPNLTYSADRDFAAVASLGILPSVLVVAPSRGFATVGDLIAAARSHAGGLTFASAGVGTATYLSAMRFQSSAGIQAVHVPFKGGPEALSEVMAGRVDFFFAPLGVAMPLIRDGKLKALVVNSPTRSNSLPNVPTTAEAGLVNAEYLFWIGLFVPAKTPREIVGKLHRETMAALQDPKVRDKLAALGVDPMALTPAEFDRRVAHEIAENVATAKALGLTAP
jgi:tripartite-type tricarboxylate transporter receptor subunit TctC